MSAVAPLLARPRAGRRLVGGLVLAVLLVGSGAAARAAVAGLTAPRPTAALARLRVVATADAGVLARPQRAADRRTPPPAGEFVSGSVRRLAVVPDLGSTLAAARTPRGELCLTATDPYLGGFRATCTTPAAFPRTGLVLHWTSSVYSGSPVPAVSQPYLPWSATAVWGPDGRLRVDLRADGAP